MAELGPDWWDAPTSTPEVLLDCHAVIGESPTWSAAEHALYWIDVKQPALHRLGPDGGRRLWHLPSDIGAFALTQGGQGAVVALRTGIFRLAFNTGEASLLAPPPFDPGLFRFNEGICDAAGRFLVGVMYDPLPGQSAPGTTAAMQRFTLSDGLVDTHDWSDLHNGFAWSADGSEFFWSHSYAGDVYRADYDAATGRLGPARPFLDMHTHGALPDGAAIDEHGCYWCAIHGAGVLHRYDPAGTLLTSIPLPVRQPTMCCFVGPELDAMVVTSAADKLSPAQVREQPHAGALFRLRPGVRGLPRPYVVR
ncbi:SMP-30/gluconolactonase/LRE family protein [Acidisphaera rubrifaciens]|uniref:Transcriptional regulator n=1 Tax=Acidisphaera rubrifaciens HS-AP3 TaxID=1231350 RepID=A0A0D6P6T0_9PROT|nr:SMP-30/gluconolactonase/LRE family protein [Acidisphaera rubrifaciens]GAN77470.1 transcriptional regulator [Acidisphaera rubrifaciens HS-AP3]